ncbi:3744_t:CDS:2 [Paraglomus occultum]|uniref:Enolase-phosphatase E1 n=1 Tax=Paraglomus occultum TaxID=144539 RepID=A0A9N8WMN0_9GLOM|nr:3744_t:CDS:2 [Paraglomus occultum]
MQSYAAVILDIEGTTTPISFVHDTLFPYVTNNIENFLKENWDRPELNEQIDLLRNQASIDVKDGIPDAKLIPDKNADISSSEDMQAAVIYNIKWQMKQDRKIGALKSFQGYMWKSGYQTGDLKGIIYDDVVEAFHKWKHMGCKIYIYSSGSVQAQKLLFSHSNQGNLLEYISGHFDTNIGPKIKNESYMNIAKSIGEQTKDIIFLTDSAQEAVAAEAAGLQVVIVVRPGNASLPSYITENANIKIIDNFLSLFNE